MTPSLPRDFGRWTGPWYLGSEHWTDNVEEWMAGAPPKNVMQRRWLRPYREVSHCGTPGCCESPNLHGGPAIGEPVPDTELYPEEDDD